MAKPKSKTEPTQTNNLPIRRPIWDDGRCGGWVGPDPDDYRQNSSAYDRWIQSMERGNKD